MCYTRLQLNTIDVSPIWIGVMSKISVILTPAYKLKAIVSQRIKTPDYDNGLLATAQGQVLFWPDANNQTVCVSMSPLGHRLMKCDP